jgi:hypothetical protein
MAIRRWTNTSKRHPAKDWIPNSKNGTHPSSNFKTDRGPMPHKQKE